MMIIKHVDEARFVNMQCDEVEDGRKLGGGNHKTVFTELRFQ